MGHLQTAIESLARGQNWKCYPVYPGSTFLVHFEADHSVLPCLAEIGDDQDFICVHVSIPARIPSKRKHEVMEYATRANTMMSIGNFDVDLDECVISYRASLDTHSGMLSEIQLLRLFQHAVSGADLHFPALMAVMFGDESPTRALDRVIQYDVTAILGEANQRMDD